MKKFRVILLQIHGLLDDSQRTIIFLKFSVNPDEIYKHISILRLKFHRILTRMFKLPNLSFEYLFITLQNFLRMFPFSLVRIQIGKNTVCLLVFLIFTDNL